MLQHLLPGCWKCYNICCQDAGKSVAIHEHNTAQVGSLQPGTLHSSHCQACLSHHSYGCPGIISYLLQALKNVVPFLLLDLCQDWDLNAAHPLPQ